MAPSAYWTLQLVGQGWVFPEMLVLEVKLLAVTVLLQDKKDRVYEYQSASLTVCPSSTGTIMGQRRC